MSRHAKRNLIGQESRFIRGAAIIVIFLAIAAVEEWAPWHEPLVWMHALTKGLLSRDSLWAILYSVVQLLIVCVCAVTVMRLFGGGAMQALKDLGLSRGIARGFLVGIIATLPMPILFGIAGHAKFNADIAVQVGVFGFISAVGEEVRFRGFAFGLLYRRLGLGFWLSVILPTAFFGLGHLYEVRGIQDSLRIVALTGLGSIWFGWLYVRWEYNLWIPIALHALMNSWWTIFGASETALGGTEANIARLLTIVLSVVLTLWHCRWNWDQAFLHIRPQEPAATPISEFGS
jgi:uncharacterized protein